MGLGRYMFLLCIFVFEQTQRSCILSIYRDRSTWTNRLEIHRIKTFSAKCFLLVIRVSRSPSRIFPNWQTQKKTARNYCGLVYVRGGFGFLEFERFVKSTSRFRLPARFSVQVLSREEFDTLFKRRKIVFCNQTVTNQSLYLS